jgi:hypothetical protein
MPKFSHAVYQFALSSFVLLALIANIPSGWAQSGSPDFTMQSSQFSPFAGIEPGGTATATISLNPVNGFTGQVSLSPCTVTGVQTTNLPVCTVSPAIATPPVNGPTVTITTTAATPAALYTVTITGTGPTTSHTLSLNLTVLAVTPSYTITVTGLLTPNTVHAGSGATATITVSSINGYTGNVTLSCSAISPTATPAPSCAFSPNPVALAGTDQTSTLTISTSGTQSAISHRRIFYALLLPFPGLTLVVAGFATGGRLRRRLLGLIILSAAASLLLLPACGTSGSSSTSSSGSTPKNTYTFTLNGADANAVAPSNSTQSVTLTVN